MCTDMDTHNTYMGMHTCTHTYAKAQMLNALSHILITDLMFFICMNMGHRLWNKKRGPSEVKNGVSEVGGQQQACDMKRGY